MTPAGSSRPSTPRASSPPASRPTDATPTTTTSNWSSSSTKVRRFSEIVSGALKDYERNHPWREHLRQGIRPDIFPIGRGEALFKCTTQYYQLPKGAIIHRKDDSVTWGIQPDLEVKMTNKEVADWLEARRDADIIIAEEDRDPDDPQTDPKDILADGLDPQLEAAVLLLKAKQLSSSVELARKGDKSLPDGPR